MENVFNRSESAGAIISSNLYNLVLGLVLFWGFFMNYLIVKNVSYESLAGINPFMFFLLYFVSCFFGVYLYSKSTNPVVSFIGYNFVVVPFGLIVNLIVHQYDPVIVLAAIRVTD